MNHPQNLLHYRNDAYAGYNSSPEILAAINMLAADALPTYPVEGEEHGSLAYQLWADPTPTQMVVIEARAWELAAADVEELAWGITTLRRA